MAILAVAPLALVALPVLPATLTAETEPRPVEVVPAKATEPAVEGTREPSSGTNKETRKAALEKLALEKLTIERTAPEKPAPKEPAREKPAPKEPVSREPAPKASAPEKPATAREPAPEKAIAQEPAPERDQTSNQGSDKKPGRAVRGGATRVPVLPGPSRKTPTARKAPAERPAAATPPAKKPAPRDTRLQLSVPRLRLENVTVGDSPAQAYLDREGIMHLSGTGFPDEPGSNTYIAGHANYDASRIPSIFRNLKDLRPKDQITLRDAAGRTYNYRVYERFLVSPHDVWVTRPIAGKHIVSLQTCFPAPTYHKRLIVRGELVS
jgi:sortase A